MHASLLLDQLVQQWMVEEKKRAFGGFWALTGFSFQTAVFLREFYGALAAESATEPGQMLQAQMERIADVLVPDGGTYVLLQVTHTATDTKLEKTLHEAYLVTRMCLADKALEPLLAHLRFRLVCTHDKVKTSIWDVQPKDVEQEIWDEMLLRFDETIEEVAGDPLDTLHVQLWRAGVHDTTSFLREAAGIVLQSFPGDLATLGRSLSSHYYGAVGEAKPRFPGAILTKDDFSRENPDAAPGVIVGRQPSLHSVGDGTLKHRAEVFASVAGDFDPWLNEALHPGVTRSSVPLFVLTGRSGDGKSMLLLQLCHYVTRTKPNLTVVHLRRSEVLPFLEALSEHHRVAASPIPILAFVDDLHALDTFEQWCEQASDACLRHMPNVALVTCGPPEQYARAEMPPFTVTRANVPRLTDRERGEFVDWYHDRTGKEPPADLASGNVLLVQLMFELTHEKSLGQFADKFRARLREIGAYDDARAILALNALDIEAPQSLLRTAEARDALEYLTEEEQMQMHFERHNEPPPPRIRLAHHGGLAWALIRTWLAGELPSLEKAWAREIARSLAAYGEWPEHAARVIYTAGAIAHEDQRGQRVDAAALLSALYALHVEACGGTPASHTVHRWLEHRLKLGDRVQLVPDPLEVTLQLLQTPDGHERLDKNAATWCWGAAQQLDDKKRAAAIREVVIDYAMRDPDPRHSAHTMMVIASTRKDRQTRRSVQQWLERFATSPAAQVVLEAVLAKNPVEAMPYAMRWFEHNQGDAQAGRMLATMISATKGRDEKVNALGVAWMNDLRNAPDVPLLLGTLMNQLPRDERFPKRALDLVSANPEAAYAPPLLATLITLRKDETSIETGTRWVAEHLDHPRALPLVNALAALSRKREQTQRVVFDWATNYGDQASNANIIAALAKSGAADLARTLLDDWLSTGPEIAPTAQMLSAVLAGIGDDDFFERVREWCLARVEHPKIAKAIEALLLYRPEDPVTIELARTWIDANPDSPHLAEITRRIPDGGAEWLRGHRTHRRAFEVLIALAHRTTGAAEADSILEFIRENEEEPLTLKIIESLSTARPYSRKVRRAAIDVGVRHLDNPFAHTFFRAVLGASHKNRNATPELVDVDDRITPDDDAALAETVLQWVAAAPENPHVPDIIATAVAAMPNDPRIVDLGIDWLLKHPQHPLVYLPLKTMLLARLHIERLLDLAYTFVRSPNAQYVEQVLAAATYASQAQPRFVDACYDYIERAEPPLRFRRWILQTISRAFLVNPDSLLSYLKRPLSLERRFAIRTAVVEGTHLSSIETTEAFLDRAIPRLRSDDRGAIIVGIVSRRVSSPAIDERIAAWLRTNEKDERYARVLAMLGWNPDQAERVLVRANSRKINNDYRLALMRSHIAQRAKTAAAQLSIGSAIRSATSP
ncbi:MAG TPA: hypothetical protein VEK11_06685 [Thermoanaerobaculia bacterium]|nr:hypothetical protein [Thermoanaerobaculia bacterium]